MSLYTGLDAFHTIISKFMRSVFYWHQPCYIPVFFQFQWKFHISGFQETFIIESHLVDWIFRQFCGTHDVPTCRGCFSYHPNIIIVGSRVICIQCSGFNVQFQHIKSCFINGKGGFITGFMLIKDHTAVGTLCIRR